MKNVHCRKHHQFFEPGGLMLTFRISPPTAERDGGKRLLTDNDEALPASPEVWISAALGHLMAAA